MVARKTRESSKFPGLSYTLTMGRKAGEFFVTFEHGMADDTFLLAEGRAYWVECSDKGTMPAAMLTHCRETAHALAARLTARKVLGTVTGQAWAA